MYERWCFDTSVIKGAVEVEDERRETMKAFWRGCERVRRSYRKISRYDYDVVVAAYIASTDGHVSRRRRIRDGLLNF